MSTLSLDFKLLEARPTKEERKRSTLFRGSRLFHSLTPSNYELFVYIIPHQRQERFMAEVGWSETGRFPWELSSQGRAPSAPNEFEAREWLIPFGDLYHRAVGRAHIGWDVWSPQVDINDPDYAKKFLLEDAVVVTKEEAQRRVEGAAHTAARDLQEVALPYLAQKMSRSHTRG